MQINYYINNQEVNNPLNNEELSVELNFDKDDVSSNAVSITEFEWGLGDQTDGNDAARLINAHRSGGLTGTSTGIFEGLPFRIELTHEGTTRQLFDGYLNTATAIYDCDRIIIQAVEKGNIDWLSDVADSVSFEYLYEYGQGNAKITNADFISIPYVVSQLPDNREALLATISLTYVLETFATELENFIELTAGLANPLNWTVYIEWVLRLVYLVSLFALLVVTIQRIRNLLIQDTKYHSAMRVRTLCEKGAAHFGFTFQSGILDSIPIDKSLNDMVIMPRKYSHDSRTYSYQGGARLLGNPTDTIIGWFSPNAADAKGFFEGTFGDLLRGLKEMFNAKIVIEGTTLRLEGEDYGGTAYNYVLPDVDQTNYSHNFDDLKSNYTVEFATDINDKNTLQNYDGTVTQITTQPQGIVNRDMVLMSGLESRIIPFSRATRKSQLTSVENIVDYLAPIIDTVAGLVIQVANAALTVIDTILNTSLGTAALISATLGITAYAFIGVVIGKTFWTIPDLITWLETLIGFNLGVDLSDIPQLTYTPIGDLDQRIGMLLLENDFLDVPKIFMIDEANTPSQTKVYNFNEAVINSSFLYENYHKIRTFVPYTGRPNANQYKKYQANGIPFCFDDYELLRTSNKLKSADGKDGVLISARWNIRNQTADIEYRINELYTNNLKIEVITPDGK